MNNPVWIMSSAFPLRNLDFLIDTACKIGVQGLELCVFRKDGTRVDHVATHLDYEAFDSEKARLIIDTFNRHGLHFSLGAYENLIGGDPHQRVKNQNHLLNLIRMAALLGGDKNGISVGTFVGYNHEWDLEEGSFEKNLFEYKKIFGPIVKYAENLGVTVVYENCPMEGWRPAAFSTTMNNLTSTLAARKLMYELIPSPAHGEIYDPSHDVWQFIDPVDVLKHSDLKRIKSIHLKTSRMKNDASAIHWGHVFGKQLVSKELAEKAHVPIPANEWDRFSYEPMVPGFGGSDSMDWRNFVDYLMKNDFNRVFSIENEGLNSKGTGNDSAVEQGFSACLSYLKPMIWPLTEDKGYCFDGQPELYVPEIKDLPVVAMKDLTETS